MIEQPIEPVDDDFDVTGEEAMGADHQVTAVDVDVDGGIALHQGVADRDGFPVGVAWIDAHDRGGPLFPIGVDDAADILALVELIGECFRLRAVGAVVGNDDGELLLVQRADSGVWLYPTGWADVGYSPAED